LLNDRNDMTRSLLTCVLTFLLFSGSSQSYLDVRNSMAGVRSVNYIIDPSDSKIEGSPYYSKNWAKGKVNFWKHSVDFDSLHFNVYKNLILFMQGGKVLTIAPEVKVNGFIIGDSRFSSFDDNEEYKNVFFKLLADGNKLKLLQYYECKLVKGKESNGVVEYSPDRYRTSNSYYAYLSNGQFYKFSRRLKLEELFGDKKSEIKAFIKQNNIAYKNEDDLVSLFKYIDQLYE
jgi:hypothetical protein